MLTICARVGQAYVALSRATSLDGLQVLNFDPAKVRKMTLLETRSSGADVLSFSSQVKAHPKVVEWSKTLEAINLA